MKIRLSSLLIPIVISFICACGNDQNQNNNADSLNRLNEDTTVKQNIITPDENKDTTEKEKKIVVKNNSKYICPQNDTEGNLNSPGYCPTCGMELIENPDYTPVKPK